MDSVILSSGLVILKLIRDGAEVFISVEDSNFQELARFPIKIALLSSVADGYSYQVANEFGSLRLSRADNNIDVRYEGKKGGNFRSSLDKEGFSHSLSIFHVDNV